MVSLPKWKGDHPSRVAYQETFFTYLCFMLKKELTIIFGFHNTVILTRVALAPKDINLST